MLTIEGWKVKDIQLKNWRGKRPKKEAVVKILRKMVFSSFIKGTMELELLYV